jgi:hypothetical protein
MRRLRRKTPPVTPPATNPDGPVDCAALDERLRSWPAFSSERAEWLAAQRDVEPCIAESLRRTREAGDWYGFELYVVAAQTHPSRLYTETLCAVLDERRDDMDSEGIVDALDGCPDPAAVPSLRRAVTWVPDWDEFGQLARKAVWALDGIGTPEAIAAIREEATDDLPLKVVEAAADALNRRDRPRG